MASSPAPGRLGDPNMCLGTDPRLHPKILGILKSYGGENNLPVAEITPESPYESIRAVAAKSHEDHVKFFHAAVFPEEPTSSAQVTAYDELIPGPDKTELRLTIRKSAESSSDAPLPGLVYIHGGGMVIGTTDNPPQNKWAESLVRTGLVVITIHFRNAYDKDGDNPFPAGLEDCATAVRWIDEHRADLGIRKVILQGESGGGNLSIATALKANKEGWVKAIDGIAAYIPFISGPAYGMPREWKLRELPSLVENDGYTLDVASCALYTKMYDPEDKHGRNPLAFPYWAQEDDLRGLPPHLIVTSELDPFRDEGIAYYRKLVGAGVKAVGKTTLGTIHGTELYWGRIAAPEFLENSIWEIKRFADSA